MTRSVFLCVLFALAACGSTPKPPPTPGTPTLNPADYLAQSVCPDGALQLAEPTCTVHPERASDPMTPRFDWGAPAGQPGYVMQAGVVSDDGSYYETIWDFPPFGPFSAAAGDGGEVYVIQPDGTVRSSVTQDGGTPHLQGFYGAGCGGTGWVAFRDDAPTGAWTTLTASLSDLPVPSACAHKSNALTRYRLETVTVPFFLGGVTVEKALPCVIGEHYNTGSLGSASAMERSLWCKGVGRTVWEAWGTSGPAPPSSDIPARCPGTSAPPVQAGWYLQDCRYATRLVPSPGPPLTGDGFGWPPMVSSWP